MKVLTTFLSGALLCSELLGQGVITRIGQDGTHFYYDGNIQAALSDAANNNIGTDTIILGGGLYQPSADLLIDTRVVMIGTGIHPDSSNAHNLNGRTVVNRVTYLNPGATGSQFHGLTFTQRVDVGDGGPSTTDVDSLQFVRCDFVGGGVPGWNAYLSVGLGKVVGGGDPSLANDTYFKECIFRSGLNLDQAQRTIVQNCALKSGGITQFVDGTFTLIENCLIFGYTPVNGSGITYRENVFLTNQGTALAVNDASSFQNNIFVGNGPNFDIVFGMEADTSGNKIRKVLNTASGVFPAIGADQVTDYDNFSYYADYHLNTNTTIIPAVVQDAGIFGGGAASAWKPGSVPFNPHWVELDAPSGTTTVNGTLPGVTIKATAQQD